MAGRDGNIPLGYTNFPGGAPSIGALAAAAARVREGDTDSPVVRNAVNSLLGYNGGLMGLAGNTGSACKVGLSCCCSPQRGAAARLVISTCSGRG